MKNQTALFKWLVLSALILLATGCKFRIGKTGGAPGEVLQVPFIVQDTTGCPNLLSLQGAFCFSNPDVFTFLEAQVTQPNNWIFNYNAENHAFTMYTLHPEGVHLIPGDTLFHLLLQLDPQGHTGDYSSISLCDNVLERQAGCLDTIENAAAPYNFLRGRIEIQDQISFSGKVRSIEDPDIGIEQVDLALESDYTSLSTTTDSTGFYGFDEVLSGYYHAQLSRTTRSQNHYSTYGLVRLARHIIGIQDLSPYYILAGDVNCDEVLDFDDIYLYQDVLLHVLDGFDPCKSWQFIPENHIFPEPDNPFNIATNWPVNVFTDSNNINFIGIEKGILPGSYPLPLSSPVIELYLDIEQEGTEVSISAKAHQDLKLSGYQLALDFNPEQLMFHKANAGDSREIFVNDQFKREGLLLLNSFQPDGSNFFIPRSGKLFELTFEVKHAPTDLSKSIKIDPIMLEPLAFGPQGEVARLDIVAKPKLVQTAFQEKENTTLMNYPNPFRDQTTFKFYMDAPGNADLFIFDVYGKLMDRLQKDLPAGSQSLDYQNAHLPTGTYYYSLHQNGAVISQQMQVVK